MKWVLTALMALILQLFLPWWSIAIAGFIAGALFIQKPGKAFLNGFFGIFALWSAVSLYIYVVNEGLLAERLADIFSLPHGLLVVLLTALIGGICGGLSAVTGNLLRIIIDKQK
jgi:hypothetical protein